MKTLNSFGVFTKSDFHKMDQSKANQTCNMYWKFVSRRIHLRLKDINREYSSLEDQMKELGQKVGGEVLIKMGVRGFHCLVPFLKTLEKELAKMLAKALAKKGAQVGGAKVAAKKVPFAGAVVGLGCGIARLCEGRPGTALLEVAFGVASTIPGVGTVASLALDGAIMAADCYDCYELVEVSIC